MAIAADYLIFYQTIIPSTVPKSSFPCHSISSKALAMAAVSFPMENWSELLHELLIEIAKQITSIEDFVSFGAVCSSWYAAATRENFTRSSQIPWLMLAEVEEQQNESERWRQFFSLSSGRIFKVILPEASEIRCVSSLGWLLTLGELKANLLHPLSRLQIQLPDLNTFQDYDEHENFLLDYVHRMVLSASPAATRDYLVMVTHGFAASLGFWRPGDASWTAVDRWELLEEYFYAEWHQRSLLFQFNMALTTGELMLTEISRSFTDYQPMMMMDSIELEIRDSRESQYADDGSAGAAVVQRSVVPIASSGLVRSNQVLFKDAEGRAFGGCNSVGCRGGDGDACAWLQSL
ncbi:hypothetical protein RJ639_041415 [Escallonia herrerae]|uniref:KIB1-4 beta-propeller domain-containing protein n=1 Tax=Escallonia herrerae TaxID=1293975 RepID=A0AA88WG33_9ASTE|nr:hypothetical protein RJ639_041415 [Escallonia herrerae]